MTSHTEILKLFPVYHKLDKHSLLDTGGDVTFDYTFDDVRVLYYRILKKIPSSFINEIRMMDFDNVLHLLQEEKFELLFSTTNISSEEINNVTLIHEERGILIKLTYNIYSLPIHTEEPAFCEYYDEGVGMTNKDDENVIYTQIYYTPSPENYKFIDALKSLMTKDESDVNLVYMFEKDSRGNFKLVPHKIEGYDIDIDKHYNDDFKEVDARIKEWEKDFKTLNKRLVMLEGVAGTGKTNYIKHLLSTNSDIRKIYIPPYYIEAINDPGFFGFIKKYKNSVLLLEDSERVLISRDIDSSNSGISVLLNLTDGILASVLNFKIICTFNTNDKQIDDALKRKGRLFLRYHFDKLSEDKTSGLYSELFNKKPPERSMSLGDIFNSDDNGEAKKEEERKIGFGL